MWKLKQNGNVKKETLAAPRRRRVVRRRRRTAMPFGMMSKRDAVSGKTREYESPGRQKFCLASGGCKLQQTRPWLGLVDLSRVPSGIFFREVYPGSKMASQNDQNKAK